MLVDSGRRDRRGRRWAAGLGFALFAAAALVGRPALAAGYSSIVVDAASGEVIHEMNADVGNYPASLTKIMTTYLTFEALKSGRITLKTQFPVSEHASVQAPSKLGLNAGDTISVENAILGVVTKSANDAAVVLAEGIGGSEQAFAEKMTAKARVLGMNATYFHNASGLPDPDQVTTARDMSVLARAVLRDFPEYYHYYSTPQFTYDGHVFENHNRMLRTYRGADGIKTGYIRASGFNLVASAERDGRRLIGVVLGSQSPSARNAQMARLLDSSFLSAATRLAALSGKPAGKPDDANVAGAAAAPAEAQASTQVASAETPAAEIADAPPAAAASSSHSKVKPAGLDRGWGVQVGAFSRFGAAHLAASKATRSAHKLLSRSKILIDTAEDDGETVYRARIMGLTETRAHKACAVLAAKKMECLTVASDGSVASATVEQGDSER